jgi:transposase
MSNKPSRVATKYSAEFRESSAKLAIDSDQPVSHTAKDLGVKVNTLHTWIHNYSQLNKSVSDKSECHYSEVQRLRKELHLVKQERDLLKKAAAYFAKESH